MAVTVTFAAKVLEDAYMPKRLIGDRDGITPVVNPFTNRPLWVWNDDIINIVDGVGAVEMMAHISGRQRRPDLKHIELTNWLTGNTFLVSRRAITSLNTKEYV